VADIAEFEHLVRQGARQVDRDGKAHAGIVAADGEEGGVDADEIAAQAHQRTAGIAGIDGGIGLDEILIGPDPHIGPVQAADDPCAHGLADLQWIADGEHEVPDRRRLLERSNVRETQPHDRVRRPDCGRRGRRPRSAQDPGVCYLALGPPHPPGDLRRPAVCHPASRLTPGRRVNLGRQRPGRFMRIPKRKGPNAPQRAT
jgi:hypothetical protein